MIDSSPCSFIASSELISCVFFQSFDFAKMLEIILKFNQLFKLILTLDFSQNTQLTETNAGCILLCKTRKWYWWNSISSKLICCWVIIATNVTFSNLVENNASIIEVPKPLDTPRDEAAACCIPVEVFGIKSNPVFKLGWKDNQHCRRTVKFCSILSITALTGSPTYFKLAA